MVDNVNASIPQDVDGMVHELGRSSRRSVNRDTGRLEVQSQRLVDGYQKAGIQEGHYQTMRFHEALWCIQAPARHRPPGLWIPAADASASDACCHSVSTPLDTSRSKGRAREASSGPLPGHTATAAGEAVTGCEIGELLHRAAQSDPSAWELIVRRYSGAVWATVRSFWLQHTDAHDAVQTTWLRLAENLHRIQHPERLGGWLTTTANRECLHILYRAYRVTTVAETIIGAAADPAGPEQHKVHPRFSHGPSCTVACRGLADAEHNLIDHRARDLEIRSHVHPREGVLSMEEGTTVYEAPTMVQTVTPLIWCNGR